MLWIGVLGGPLVWAADHQVAYWLVYHSCQTQSLGWLYAETVAAWAGAIACTFVG